MSRRLQKMPAPSVWCRYRLCWPPSWLNTKHASRLLFLAGLLTVMSAVISVRSVIHRFQMRMINMPPWLVCLASVCMISAIRLGRSSSTAALPGWRSGTAWAIPPLNKRSGPMPICSGLKVTKRCRLWIKLNKKNKAHFWAFFIVFRCIRAKFVQNKKINPGFP